MFSLLSYSGYKGDHKALLSKLGCLEYINEISSSLEAILFCPNITQLSQTKKIKVENGGDKKIWIIWYSSLKIPKASMLLHPLWSWATVLSWVVELDISYWCSKPSFPTDCVLLFTKRSDRRWIHWWFRNKTRFGCILRTDYSTLICLNYQSKGVYYIWRSLPFASLK